MVLELSMSRAASIAVDEDDLSVESVTDWGMGNRGWEKEADRAHLCPCSHDR